MTAALKQATQLKIQMNVVKGPHAGQVFHLSKPTLTIGRGPENDVVLVNDPMVSRAHARIQLVNNEFELVNLSEKNFLLFDGQVIQKVILINDSVFQIGDCEIKFQFDLGQAVVSVPPKPTGPETQAVNLTTPKAAPQLSVVKSQVTNQVAPRPQSSAVPTPRPASSSSAVALKSSTPPSPLTSIPSSGYGASAQQQVPPQFKRAQATAAADESAKRFRFILIALIVIGGAVWFLMPSKAKKSAKQKPLIKYEDEVAIANSSKNEAELLKKLAEDRKNKDSPHIVRAEENFVKGMRDFNLGNYARAQDFFQVVLNLIPDHALARRHLYLSKVRFDELVQAKLVLGESYYQKHNFDMCASMFQQVLDMLQGKSNDEKYKLAKRMLDKCQLAAEGIR